MLVLQKLEKALVHSGDVIMNKCFFKVEKKWLYLKEAEHRTSEPTFPSAVTVYT